jgi:hypothetical protein
LWSAVIGVAEAEIFGVDETFWRLTSSNPKAHFSARNGVSYATEMPVMRAQLCGAKPVTQELCAKKWKRLWI